MDRIDPARIQEMCPQLRRVLYFPTLVSTNLFARELIAKEACDGTLVLADEQTGGRGRLGRSWDTQPGTSVAMSYITRPDLPAKDLPMITLACALAVSRAVDGCSGLETRIKWPNDIYCGGKKLCGILTEGVTGPYGSYAVIGIGVNVNAEEIPAPLRASATSVRLCAGREISRTELIVRIIEGFGACSAVLCRDRSMRGLMEEYNAKCLDGGSRIDASGMPADPRLRETGTSRI